MSKGYQTAMAAEFFVMSTLYRLGLDASLTLGNRKQVDILVERPRKPPITIDVKGLRDRSEWLLGGWERMNDDSHFLIFVSFESGFGDPGKSPTCFVVPQSRVTQFAKEFRSGKTTFYGVGYGRIKTSEYLNAWHLITEAAHLQED
jgi:hypothetical protein